MVSSYLNSHAGCFLFIYAVTIRNKEISTNLDFDKPRAFD